MLNVQLAYHHLEAPVVVRPTRSRPKLSIAREARVRGSARGAATLLSTDIFCALLHRTQGPLIGFVRGLLRDAEDARDVAQEVFADAWRALLQGKRPFVPEGDVAGMRRWLFHAAYCRAVSILRHRGVLRWQSLDAAESVASSDEYIAPQPFEDRVAEAEALRTALRSLAPDDAAWVLLNVVQGFTAGEIAAIAGTSPEAARRRISRAKERLRQAYFTTARAHERVTAFLPPEGDGEGKW